MILKDYPKERGVYNIYLKTRVPGFFLFMNFNESNK